MNTVKLSDLVDDKVAVLIGQDRGLAFREALDIDAMDKSPEPVEVVIPESLTTLTPSFVQGLFATSVHTLGEEAFYAHYKFNAPNHMISDIRSGIDRALTSRRIAGR